MGAFEHFPAQKVLKHLTESEAAIAANTEKYNQLYNKLSSGVLSSEATRVITVDLTGAPTADVTDIIENDGFMPIFVKTATDLTLPAGTAHVITVISSSALIASDSTLDSHTLCLWAELYMPNGTMRDSSVVYVPKGKYIGTAVSASRVYTETITLSSEETYPEGSGISEIISLDGYAAQVDAGVFVTDELGEDETEAEILADIELKFSQITEGFMLFVDD